MSIALGIENLTQLPRKNGLREAGEAMHEVISEV